MIWCMLLATVKREKLGLHARDGSMLISVKALVCLILQENDDKINGRYIEFRESIEKLVDRG